MEQTAQTRKTLYQKYADIMPRGAGALFFIQTFSTLAFSVLYSTLVLYATNGLHMSDTVATGITTSFIAFNFALHLLGGYLGGRFLSYRMLFCIGMVMTVLGCGLISIPDINMLYCGLAAFLTGAGLNVTCINCMLTQLFRPEDKRREAAFLWNYSGMNIGFFVGFSMSGYLQLQNNYHLLFILAAAGNGIALLLSILHWKKLSDTNTSLLQLDPRARKIAHIKGVFSIIILVLSLRFLLEHAAASNQLILIVGAGMMGVIALMAMKQPTRERSQKIWAYLILSISSLVFWTLYQMAPMGLTLFIERNVDRHFLGFLIAPQWVQNINTIVIIIGGPLLSILFTALRYRGKALTIPLQFSIALLCIGVALAILPLGIRFANAAGYVNFNWILVSYILQSLGELFISPIGYAMVGQLAPAHLQGILMGTWMMMTGVSAALSGYFSQMALGSTTSIDPLLTNASFGQTFGLLGWMSIAAGVVMLLMMPFMSRLMHERKLTMA